MESCFPSDENILLIGNTSYKETLIKNWLKSVNKKSETYFLAKNTEVQNLIGFSSLDDEERLGDIRVQIEKDFKENFNKDINDLNEENVDEVLNKRTEKNCMKYMIECYNKFKTLTYNLKKNKNNSLKTETSFHLGIIPSSYIYGKILILKGIENPPSSVVERLNSCLENPRYLVLTEDNQEIFNNKNIFEKVYKNQKNKISLPNNPGFKIIFTSRQVNNKAFSEAFKSRCTIIHCPSYKEKKYLTLELKPDDNYEKIMKKILIGMDGLQNEMNNFRLNFKKNIEFLTFIRFCKTSKNLLLNLRKNEFSHQNLIIEQEQKHIIGIAALRTIFDKLNYQERIDGVRNCLREFLPKKLYELLVGINKDKEEFPFEYIPDDNKEKKYVKSKYSGISIQIQNSKEEIFDKNIIWTNSFIDMADALLISLAANAIFILEGPPGRGKTKVTEFMYKYLNINCERINFSPSTKKEEIFSMIIPTMEGNNIKTKELPKTLLKIIEESKCDNNIFKKGLLLDEMNLSNDNLREDLYSYLGAIKNNDNKEYIARNGKKYSEIGNIAVTITMNGSTMSNSRTSLSDSFINLSHTLRLQNYTENEYSELIKEKLKNTLEEADIKYIISKYILYSKDNKNNSFREIMKMQKYFSEIKHVGYDELLDLILYPEKEKIFPVEDCELKLYKNTLFFGKQDFYITYPKKSKNEIKTLFTNSQKDALMKILVGIKAENTILLTGEINSGKTFLIEQLANLIGIKLRTIQFMKETNSSDLIGKFELTKKNISSLKTNLNKIQNYLIKNEFNNITKFIIFNKKMDIRELINILNEIKEQKIGDVDIKLLKEDLDKLKFFENIDFDFIYSILINAMKNGEWVLLDDIHFAKAEIERLMSLLEEEPTLTIYEDKKNVIYKKKNKEDQKDQILKNDINYINPNFRLFITSSNEKIISSAVKSRCLHIKLNQFKDPEDYAILISNSLNNSGLDEENIIKISKIIGNSFYEMKNNEKEGDYILRNYKLSTINLINFCKLLKKSNNINGKNLSQFIKYSLISGFKNDVIETTINSLKNNLMINDGVELNLIPNIKINHEIFLSQIEINALSYYAKNLCNEDKKRRVEEMKNFNKIIKDKIGKFSNLTEDDIDWNINENSIIEKIKVSKLINTNLFLFSFKEMEILNYELKEVFEVVDKFTKKYPKIYHSLFFLRYLIDLLKIIEEMFENNDIYNEKIEDVCKPNKFEYLQKEKLFYFKNMIIGFDSIYPMNINILEIDKSIISLFYQYYFENEYNKNNDKGTNIYFRMLRNNKLKKILKNYKIKIPKEKSKINNIFNLLTSCKYNILDVEDEKNNIKIRITKNKTINLKDIDNEYGEWKMTLEKEGGDDYNEEETIIKKKDDYFVEGYDYLLNYYKDESDIIKNYWYYRIYIMEIQKFKKEDLKNIMSPEIFYFFEGIDHILKHSKKEIWKDIKKYIILGLKFFEGIREINEENKIKLNNALGLFNNYEKEVEIKKVLEIFNDLNQFFINYNSKEYWDKIEKEIEEKKMIIEKENIGMGIQNKKKRCEKELETVLEGFKEFTKYQYLIKSKQMIIQNLINENINDKKFEENFKREILELIKNINFYKSKIKQENKQNNDVSSSYILSSKSNKPPSNYVKILYKYSRLRNLVEKMKNNDDKKLKDEFSIEFNDSEENIKDLEIMSLPEKDKVKFYERTANYIIIKNMIINKNNNEIIFAKKLIRYLLNIFEFKDEIEDLSSKFKDDDYLYIPLLNIDDINHYFLLIYSKDFHFNRDINDKDLQNFDLTVYENYEEKIKDFKNNGLPEIKIYDKGIQEIISFIEDEEWVEEFSWLKQSYEELKKDSWKKPNQLLIKKKHSLFYEDSKKIFDGSKIDIKSLFSCYESRKPGTTKKWKTFPEIEIQNISEKMENSEMQYKYGYRIMELYNFDLFRDDISESMLIIINSIDKILEEKLENNLSEKIIKIISKFYEEYIIENIAQKEVPVYSKIIKILQYLLYYFCQIYKEKYTNELKSKENEIKKKIIKIKNIIEEISDKAIKILKEKNNIYEEKKRKYDEDVKEEYDKALEEFSKNKKSIIEKFEKSKEYEEYFEKKSNFTVPNEDEFDENTKNIKIFEEAKNNIKNIENKNLEEINNVISAIKIEKLNIIDNEEHRNFIKLKKEIKQIYGEINSSKGVYDKLNPEEIINKIPADVGTDNFIDINKLKDSFENNNLIKSIENLKSYNCNIFEIQPFEYNDNNFQNNIEIEEYIEKIKEKFFQSNLNFIFTKNEKPFFLHLNMRINLGIYLDKMTNNISSVRIKNFSKEEIKYKFVQKNNFNIIKTNITNKSIRNLKKYEDLEIKFTLKEMKEGLKKVNFELILLDQSLQETNICSIEVLTYFIPLILKFSINNENYEYKKENNDNIIKINHHINNFNILYKIPGCEYKKGPKIGCHLKTINKEKMGINNEEKGKICIKNNFDKYDPIKYILSLTLNSEKILSFDISYEKPEFFGLIMFDYNKYYIREDFCLGKVNVLKGVEKEIYLFNMTYKKTKNFQIKYNKDLIELQYDEKINCIDPGKILKIKIKNENLNNEECKIILNEENFFIEILNMEYPKLKKTKDEIFCEFNNKTRGEIENYNESKKFELILINKEFILYKKTISEIIRRSNCFSAFLIFKNKIIDNKIEESYEYKNIDKYTNAYGFSENKFLLSKPDEMKIILKQKRDSIFTKNQRQEFKNIINDKNNFLNKIQSSNLNDINYAINYLLSEGDLNNNIDLVNFDEKELDQMEINEDQTSIKNIIKFLIKYYFSKNEEDTKNDLMQIYKTMYCERTINLYFIPNLILSKNIKIFLNKLSYLISFVFLCVSPGDLLENELKEKNFKNNEVEIDNQLKVKKNLLDKHFEKYIKYNIIGEEQNNIYNNDFIYFNGDIYPEIEKNKNIFDKFNEHESNIIKEINQEFKYQTNEQYFECSNDIITDFTNKIKSNGINCFNLLIYLKIFEKYIISIPFIFSKEDRRKDSISNAQMLYDFMCILKKSNIYQETYFHEIINKYFDEFEYLLSNFSCFKILNKKNQDDFEFNFVQKYELPCDKINSIFEFDDLNREEQIKNEENQTLNPFEGKSYDDDDSFTEKGVENRRKKGFKGTIENSSNVYEPNRIMDINDQKREKNNIGGVLEGNDDNTSDSNSEPEEKNKKNKNKNLNDMGFNNLKSYNNDEKKNKNSNYEIDAAKYNIENAKDIPRTSSEKMLELIIQNIKSQKIKEAGDKFGSIKDPKFIEKCIFQIDFNRDEELKNKNLNEIYVKNTFFIQNLITNAIKKEIINFKEQKIKTLENSYIDLSIDISQMMSKEQRISALILSIALCKSLTSNGVKFRISVFGETNNIWLLSDKFEDNNTNILRQLNRLRDALNCGQRFQSFPANALIKLKENFENQYIINFKYAQILISNLISPQVVDDTIDWDIITKHENIIIFGLKTNFNKDFIKGLNVDINNLLNIKYTKDKEPRSERVFQEFFDPENINKNNLKDDENSFKKLIKGLLSALLSNKEPNDDISKRKIKTQKLNLENKIEIKDFIPDITKYLNNEKNNEFFAQNKENNYNPTSNIYEKYEKLNISFPNLEELSDLSNDLSNRNYSNQNILEKKIKFDKNFDFLNSSLNNYFEKNFASGKIFCSSGGNFSIKGIQKFISSGFTDTNIFEKKSNEDTRKYIISFIFDISISAFSIFSSGHTILTILIMLLVPSIIENNEEIFIDVIISTNKGIKIIDYNTSYDNFQKSEKIKEIISIIKNESNQFCCPGTCLYTAYKLLSERNEKEKLFLITDNFILDKNELDLTYELINKLENFEIDLITIGVGSYPYGIDKMYSKCCYTQSLIKLKECFSILFNNSLNESSMETVNESSMETVKPSVIKTTEISENEYNELINYISKSPIDKKLEESIIKTPLYIFNMILNDENILKPGYVTSKVVNPDKPIYIDNVFKKIKSYTCRILIVLLYYGEFNQDQGISEEEFIKNKGKEIGTGTILRTKGLEYTIVYNYQDAIDELTMNESGRCRYIETWIFCSDGSGEYPKGGKTIFDSDSQERRGDGREKTKKNNEEELIPFLETVAEYNRNGGALLLFCDNEPFTFEANLLLSKYLNFEEEIKKRGANFIMGGNYVRDPDKTPSPFITVRNESGPKRATFDSNEFLEPPGRENNRRLTLRVGIEHFNEGITLSYAKTLDGSENFEPFIPFSYLTDDKDNKTFILFYDPKIDNNKKFNRGPIVVHGGFTSAFYEFKEEGTGQLIISIACWLGRIEEGYREKFTGKEFFIPPIQKKISGEIYKDWYQIKSIYSILILDFSISMSSHYRSLIDLTKKILDNQKKDEEIIIIFFGTNAEVVTKEKIYELYTENSQIEQKINEIICDGSTNYYAALNKAMDYKSPSKEYILKRLLFFTDGENNGGREEDNQKICNIFSNNLNYKISFIAYGNSSKFGELKKLKHDNFYIEEDTKDFDKILKLIEKQFTT